MVSTRRVSLLSLAVLTISIRCIQAQKKVFCYYSSFAQTRPAKGKFGPEDINPFLCTHVIFAFVDITPDGRDLRTFNWNDVGNHGLYQRTIALKNKNPRLKILLAVGGWHIGSKPFIPMINNARTRRTWVRNVISYLRRYNFDGMDMDWEFPGTRGSAPDDKYKFTELLADLYHSFIEESKYTGRDKLILTLATAAGTYYINQAYEPSKIINYIDYMLLMTYNYHGGSWEHQTGHHSGLFPYEYNEDDQLNQQWSIDYWLNAGVSKDRLIVGIPTYGMSFTLANSYSNGVKALATGTGAKGEYTGEKGILSYYEICERLNFQGWHAKWIDSQMVPYAHGDDQWVGYENRASVRYKALNILKRDLAGAFVWALEMDDFTNTCGEGEFPLLGVINEILRPYYNNNPDIKIQPILKSDNWASTKYSPEQQQGRSQLILPNNDNNDIGNENSYHERQLNRWRKKQLPTLKRTWRRNLGSISTTMITTTTTSPTTASASTTSTTTRTTTTDQPTKQSRPKHYQPKQPQSEQNHWKHIQPDHQTYPGQTSHIPTNQHRDPFARFDRHEFERDILQPKWPSLKSHTSSASRSTVSKHETDMGKSPTVGTKINPEILSEARAATTNKLRVVSKPRSNIARPARRQFRNRRWRSNPGVEKTKYSSVIPKSERASATEEKSKDISHSVALIPQSNGNDIWNSKPKAILIAAASAEVDDELKGTEFRKRWKKPEYRTSETAAYGDVPCRELGAGIFPDPKSCKYFYLCIPTHYGDYTPVKMSCPIGTRFDRFLGICNHAANVMC